MRRLADTSELGYESAVSDDLDDVDFADTPQFAESDVSYVTRLTWKVGEIVKPVDGHLVLEHVGDGDPETELQEIFATKEQVIAAAQAKFKRTTKGNQAFRFLQLDGQTYSLKLPSFCKDSRPNFQQNGSYR